MLLDSLNIDLIQVFVTVSEQKSINKSSEILTLSQPAISKKIKQLESYFDTQLFSRSSKGMELTPAGKDFYKKAKVVLTDFQKLHLIEKKESDLSKLKIGALDSVASIWYPYFFKNALFSAGSVKLSNEIMDLITPFNNGELNSILIDKPFGRLLTQDYEVMDLYEEPYEVIYSVNNSSLINSKKDTLTLEDLQKQKLIMHPRLCPVHDKLVKIFKNQNMALPEIYEVDFVESRLSMVAISDLITILPRSLAEQKVKENSQLKIKHLPEQFIRKVALFTDAKTDIRALYKLLNQRS